MFSLIKTTVDVTQLGVKDDDDEERRRRVKGREEGCGGGRKNRGVIEERDETNG